MPKLPVLKPRQVESILIKNGFVVARQTGSHRIFENARLRTSTTVPFHIRDVPQGTLKSIIKQSGLPEELFTKKGKGRKSG